MAPQLAPPGSSSYSSSTLHVGDGTWDSSRNTFLLPNLVGLNFATTRYNGMGNRFAGLPQYHNLIRGHGTVAAITFLLIVPSAILIARFYRRRPGWALRLHIWLQIITVALTTVVFVLGWFAVGPNRSLSNPHHSIGLTIYVLILFQAIGGWWVHSREKGKVRRRVPLKLMLHQWLGRGIALLGIAQIPLGLTLYGSPAFLFVLYTLVVFTLLLIYFVLSYREAAPIGVGRRSSVGSTSEVVEDRRHRRHGGLGALAGAGAAGAGLAALSRFRRRSRSRSPSRHESRVDVVGSRPPSGSYIANEKYSGRDDKGGNWRDQLLKVGALAGGAALIKNFMDRRRDKEKHAYRSTTDLGGPYSMSQESISRVEEGRPPSRIDRPHSRHRRSQSLSSVSSRTSIDSRRRGRGHKLRDGVETLGAIGLLRAAFKGRRQRKEQRRIEDIRRREIEEERLARKGSQHRYTGDGFPRRGGRRGSLTSTDYTSPTQSGVDARHHHHGVPPPLPNQPLPAAIETATAGRTWTTNVPNPGAPPLAMPEPPRNPQAILHESSGSDAYLSPGGRRHRRHHSAARDGAAVAGVGTGAAVAGLGAGGVASSHHLSGESVASPPVSVKVKLHGDGRHVTLRRLPEEEAATEREVRQGERSQIPGGKNYRRHRHRGSESELSPSEVVEGGDRWRRVEDLERMQAEEQQRRQQQAATVAHNNGLVPPPPIPAASTTVVGSNGAGPGSVGSPGTVTTEASGVGGDYASRRQRRRAERAQQGYGSRRPAGTVDFE